MNKRKSYIIAAATSIVSTILILLSLQLILRKDLPYSREYLLSGTLLQNYNNYFGIVAIVTSAGVISYVTGVRPFLIAIFVVIIFPILTIYEGMAYPSSHNLFPFEIVMYIIMGVPPFLGALVGYSLKNKGNNLSPNKRLDSGQQRRAKGGE